MLLYLCLCLLPKKDYSLSNSAAAQLVQRILLDGTDRWISKFYLILLLQFGCAQEAMPSYTLQKRSAAGTVLFANYSLHIRHEALTWLTRPLYRLYSLFTCIRTQVCPVYWLWSEIAVRWTPLYPTGYVPTAEPHVHYKAQGQSRNNSTSWSSYASIH